MSGRAVALLCILYLLGMLGLFIAAYDALQGVEDDVVHIMNRWCGPETAKRFKELRMQCEGLDNEY
jgi:hypothetical protein